MPPLSKPCGSMEDHDEHDWDLGDHPTGKNNLYHCFGLQSVTNTNAVTCYRCGKVIPNGHIGRLAARGRVFNYCHFSESEEREDCYTLVTVHGDGKLRGFPPKEQWSMEMNFTEVDPKLFQLLTGQDPDEPPKTPHWHLVIGDHTMEAWDPEITEYIRPSDGKKMIATTFKQMLWLCGPHDKDMNHV